MNGGPFDLLDEALRGGEVRVLLHSGGELFGTLLSYDKHFNLVLRNARLGERSIPTYFLRGDNVVLVQRLSC